jgi:hypothetical protein
MVMTSASGEGASTDPTLSPHVEHAVGLKEHIGDIAISKVNFASADVTGDPSCHLASVRILIVSVMPSAPSSGIAVARSGTTSPSLLKR